MTGVLSDVRLTNLLAQGSGEILKGIRGVGLLRDKELAQAGDELAQNWIARVLAQHRPDDGFLSEEAKDNPTRLQKNGCGLSTRSMAQKSSPPAARTGPCISR